MEDNIISINFVKEILQGSGVKPSLHRISVLKYLMEKKGHPSVDVIYRYLLNNIPTLSKTTVYNTLKLLTEKGIIVALHIDEVELRYDYIINPHAHFVCIKCGNIYDIDYKSVDLDDKNIEGHEILEAQVNFKGICKKCQK